MRNPRRLTLFLLLSAFLARAESVDKMPPPAAYVNDYANAFHTVPQSEMETLCVELHQKTKAQIFVVTVNSLSDASVEEFANQLFHKWKVGEKKTDRGALILLAVQEHEYRIEVGYGLEGILNDAKAGDIGRAMVPDLRSANYDAAATASLHAVAQIIADDAHVTLDSLQQPASAAATTALATTNKGQPFPLWLFWCIWCGIFGSVIVGLILARRRGWKSTGGTTFWTTGTDPNSSSNSTPSSSDSFSGGDGGDSGGGGASGSW